MAQAGFLDVQELKGYLSANSSSDADVTAVGEAACALVVNEVGPVVQTSITDEYTYANSGWAGLRFQPNAIVASTAGSVADWKLTAFGIRGPFPDGPMFVTYTTGATPAPVWAVAAAKIIALHLWRTQLGPLHNQRNPQQAAPPGSGYTIPNQAAAFLEPHRLGPRLG